MRQLRLLGRALGRRPASFALVAVLLSLAVLSMATPARDVRALPPAGTDVLRAYGQVSVESRKGAETIALAGTVTVQRGTPYLDGGVEVADTEIVSMSLSGQSLVGPISVAESATRTSAGQIRSLQPPPTQFPASSFFDAFVTVSMPGSPYSSVSLANIQALRVTSAGNVPAWPPTQLKYQTAPVKGVDNDGDTRIDEDSSDDDRDHLFDEDPIDGYNNDTDARVDEDPPLAQCTLALCDNDGDGLIDEDPSCYPLFPSMPAGVCVVSLSISVYADTDGDGCTDAHESGPDQRSGGQRDPLNFWDFYDPNRNRVVDLSYDILQAAARFDADDAGAAATINRTTDPLSAPPPAPAYHPAFDRGARVGQNPWNLGPPDGIITLGIDIVAAAVQFDNSCANPP